MSTFPKNKELLYLLYNRDKHKKRGLSLNEVIGIWVSRVSFTVQVLTSRSCHAYTLYTRERTTIPLPDKKNVAVIIHRLFPFSGAAQICDKTLLGCDQGKLL